MPILQFLSYHFPPLRSRAQVVWLRHFRNVTPPRHGNNVVADGCCVGSHLGVSIMQG